MEEQLISKKDLLDEADISYGQLYRWKRKELIPEDWFVRKSTFTGQETFFPKEKILARINKIKELKNDLSLDDLVEVFSPQSSQQFDRTQLFKCNIVTESTLSLFPELIGDKELFSFHDILYLYITHKSLTEGEIGMNEATLLLETMQQKNTNEIKSARAILARKMGMAIVILTEKESNVQLDKHSKVIVDISLEDQAQEVKNLLFLGGV
ncbi:DUF4004 family protein [Sutcliffiella rhizosphaerae]|uniref:DUF4004 family protein n=1 Tax=Sutcliffiella rhizosphaerae TaxID=2880967 RepID=A0ABM8YJ68_9BACI|nr:DUF4004 family protein [Sutcliffiella rhizosphaerae]CAG9619975.1 hypothetical protein BACCIP111883_00743 [Sutcliffiella rhizosphaerae]